MRKTRPTKQAIEIKSLDQIGQTHLQGLRSFLEGYPKAEAICVSPVTRTYRAGAFRVLPWQEVFGPDYLGLRA